MFPTAPPKVTLPAPLLITNGWYVPTLLTVLLKLILAPTPVPLTPLESMFTYSDKTTGPL